MHYTRNNFQTRLYVVVPNPKTFTSMYFHSTRVERNRKVPSKNGRSWQRVVEPKIPPRSPDLNPCDFFYGGAGL
jgi:hypothetical protein